MPARFSQTSPILGMHLFSVRDNILFLAVLPNFVPWSNVRPNPLDF
jgi:hypothetical protein